MKTVEDNRPLPADGPLSDGALTRLYVKFARFLAEATSCDPELERVFALLSNSASRGHICLDLEEMDAWFAGAGHWTDGKRAATNFRALATKLRNAKAVGEMGEYKPRILAGNRLYLYRYWDYERRIIEQVGKRVGGAGARRGPGNLKEMLDRYFPGADKDGPDWQKVAAATAMTVHKCQGSEFDGVLFVLPASESPIFTRELCYTAITRAREHLTIMADPDEIKRAVQRKVSRKSGLTDALTI